ncbi:MAG: hypothetical protein L3J54_09705 [Draconibacterium sp.]|nr:hypothetical protein [Draconibacterium sp.]
MTNFYDYRFIFLDFVQIMRENSRIRTHYLELTKQRESQFMQLFDLLMKEGVLRKPILKNEYKAAGICQEGLHPAGLGIYRSVERGWRKGHE